MLALVFSAGLALAQQPAATPDPANQRLDSVRASLDQIEQTLTRQDVSDAALQDLRARLEPLSRSIQTTLDEVGPRLTSIKARLDQLGPKPGEKDPPEPPNVSAERLQQQNQYDEVDATAKRARLLDVRRDQIDSTVIDRRRALFTQALFSRSYSLISPMLWMEVAQELPRDVTAVSTITMDWLSSLSNHLAGLALVGFLAGLVTIGVGAVAASAVARRVARRDPAVHDPSALRKAMGAVWTAIVTVIVPLVVIISLVGLARTFELSTPRFEPLVGALFDAATRIALTLGIARGLLAPGLISWRLLDLGDPMVERILRLAVTVAVIVSVTKVLEATAAVIAASLTMSVTLRGTGALMVAMVLALGLYGMAGQPREEDDCLGPRITPGARDWYGPMRMLAWATVAAIGISVVIGYIAFAAFLVDQLVWITFIGCTLYLLTRFAHEAILAGFAPQAPVGRLFVNSVGLRRQSLELIAVLLAGLVNLALIVVAIMLALAPWGIESTDMVSSVRAAIFGFKVGDVNISLASIIFAFALFGLTWGAIRALQGWFDANFLPLTQLDAGLQNSIRTSLGYVGFLAALAVGLGYLGLNFERVAIIAGALSVGIGFGLQSIVGNFVSGLILLWERAIRVGDWVVVGTDQGYVRRINVRSTEIETFDRATMIVPNSNLVTGVVKNWVRGDKVGRIKVPISVNTGVDPEKVRELLIEVARGHDKIQKLPAPNVLFTSMSTNAINFELVCFVSDVETSVRITSDLNFAIFKRFREAGFELMSTSALPPVATISGIEHLAAFLDRTAAERRAPKPDGG